MNRRLHALPLVRVARRAQTARTRLLHGMARLALVSMAFLAAPAARAQSAPADTLKLFLEKAASGLPGRVEVQIGHLDERLRLAPCARIEPFVPPGTRLWGRSQIGLRCAEGASWTVYLPVEIRVFGSALVAARTIAYGQLAGPDDAKLAEVELSRESGQALADLNWLEGKSATRAIGTGQVLRAEYFRAPPAVGAGDSVRLIYSGAGFSVTAGGRALGAANEGQPVRVQTESGRIVQGVARTGRTVEMRL